MAVTANQIMTGARDFASLRKVPIAASTHIWENTLIFLNAAGFAINTVASAQFWGIAKKEVDNSSGSAGDLDCEVFQKGSFEMPMSGVADTDRGTQVEGVDNFTIQTLSAGPRIGTVINAPTTGIAEVEIDIQA